MNSKYEVFSLNGKKVYVFNDLVSFAFRVSMYEFVRKSTYRIGWADATYTNYPYIYSSYSLDDLANCNFVNELETSYAKLNINLDKHRQTMVNLSVASEPHWCHSHPKQTVILYYANPEWKEEWGGETLFFSESLDDVKHASTYKPGKVVVFDGEIPHTIRTQAMLSTPYRFTVSMFLDCPIEEVIRDTEVLNATLF